MTEVMIRGGGDEFFHRGEVLSEEVRKRLQPLVAFLIRPGEETLQDFVFDHPPGALPLGIKQITANNPRWN